MMMNELYPTCDGSNPRCPVHSASPEQRAAMELTIKGYLDTNADHLLQVSRKNMAAKIADLVIAYHWPTRADLLPGADIDAFALSGPRPPGIPTPIRTAYPYDEPGVATHE